jgi:hypothetical protein
MKKAATSLIGAVALVTTTSATYAQDQVAPTAAVSENSQAVLGNACVIELWVAKRYGVDGSSGAGQLAFGLLGALIEAAANEKGDAEKKSEMMEIIPPEFIKSVFMSTDLTTRLKRDAVMVNYHELSDSNNEINVLMKAKTRSTPETSDCYYEVFVNRIAASQYLGSKTLTVDFKLKRFTGQNAIKVENESRREKLSLFPTKDPAKKAEAAENLRQAFQAAVNKFVEKRFK